MNTKYISEMDRIREYFYTDDCFYCHLGNHYWGNKCKMGSAGGIKACCYCLENKRRWGG